MVIRYEDLRHNPEELVGRVAAICRRHARRSESIRRAIPRIIRLRQMRAKKDNAKKAGEHSILLGNRTGADEVSRFVRKGAVGGWRDKLTDAQVRSSEQYAGNTLAALGYEPGLVRETVY